MEQTETTAQETSGRKERSQELIRPVQGRMLAGVAQGVADNFGISEWIPRVFFVVTAFMGGLGIALYAAGWAFIRSEDETDTPAERFFSSASGSRSWIGIALIVLAGVIVLDNFTFLSGEVVWAGALLVIGLMLYMGYIPAGARANTGERSDAKEGVQQMTTSDTLVPETSQTPSGDSPAGGYTPPPPTPMPTPPDLPPPAPREHSILGRLTIGIVLLGLGTLAILDNIGSLPIDADPRHYLALAVAIIGGGLLVGAVLGRARWLILVGAILVPTLVFSPVFEYDWDGRSFDMLVVPATFEDLEPEYSIDAGSLVVDLTELDWDGDVVELSASADFGNIEIRVPADVEIQGEATADIGRVSGPDSESFGFGERVVELGSPGDIGILVLDLEINVGNIEVVQPRSEQ
jgi:phage shock protein PspC (stress-responsive transcriptional regulator)